MVQRVLLLTVGALSMRGFGITNILYFAMVSASGKLSFMRYSTMPVYENHSPDLRCSLSSFFEGF